MLPYYLSFLHATLFAGLASRMTNGRKRWLFISIACVPLVLLAGFRSLHVGTDVTVYLQQLYWRCSTWSFTSVFHSNAEPLFVLLVWVATKLFGSIQGVMACVEVAMLVPFAIASNKFAPRNLGLAFLLYCLFFYLFGLNIMRQGIAISFLLLAFAYLSVVGNKRAFWALMVVACLFHQMSLIGVVAYVVHEVSESHFVNQNTPRRHGLIYLLFFGLVIGAVAALLLAPSILRLFVRLTSRYTYQLEHLHDFDGIVIKGILIPLSFALIYFVFSDRKLNSMMASLLFLVLIAALLWQFSSISSQIYRLGMQFQIYSIPLATISLETCSSGKDRHIMIILFALCGFMFWHLMYASSGYAGTIPYHSSILPILNM